MTCKICGGEQYEASPHTTEEHTEDWVNLADARYTGEVIYMPAVDIFNALDALGIKRTLNESTRVHVDRQIISALVDSLILADPYGDPSVGIFENWDASGSLEILSKHLKDNPVRES
jgi:hypothetical protein